MLPLMIALLAAEDPSLKPIVDDPGLPRVLLIGDSISMGYTLPVRRRLAGLANVHRIPENGGPTSRGVERLEAWLGESKWDVIHVNFGLHDLKIAEHGGHQVEPADYEANLARIIGRLKQTGAKVIYATTTPVPEGKVNPPRRPEDVPVYNDAARRVCDAADVPINDLYTFCLPRLAEIQTPVNVHFKPAGYEALADEVTRHLRAALGLPEETE